MQVHLLAYTPDAERVVASAARLCYSAKTGEEIIDSFADDKVETFLQRLVSLGHYSPFEHAVFTFAIDGVSRTLSHQLVRHRIASYSQKSQRYVKESGFAAVMPATVAAHPEAQAVFDQTLEQIQQAYDRLIALGIPAEDARYLLPNATETNLVATMNARSLLNFFSLRCCTRAQKEIRDLANLMLKEVQEVAPLLFAKAGPSCITQGVCYEGDMCCKKGLVEIRNR